MKYYYLDAKRQNVGPVSLDELRQVRADNFIQDETLVIAHGAREWISYSKLMEASSDAVTGKSNVASASGGMSLGLGDATPAGRTDMGFSAEQNAKEQEAAIVAVTQVGAPLQTATSPMAGDIEAEPTVRSPDAGAQHSESPTPVDAVAQSVTTEVDATAGLRCPECGMVNAAGAMFCIGDGIPLDKGALCPSADTASPGSGTWRCPGCGSKYPSDVEVCPNECCNGNDTTLALPELGKLVVSNSAGSAVGQEGTVQSAGQLRIQSRGRFPRWSIFAVAGALVVAFALAGYFLVRLSRSPGARVPVIVAAAIETRLAAEGFKDVVARVSPKFTVSLNGKITSREEERRAVALARTEPGVLAVTSFLAIEPVRSPATVEGEINQALRKAGYQNINAVVDDSSGITLQGSVANEGERRRAKEIAKTASGALAIHDRIFIIDFVGGGER